MYPLERAPVELRAVRAVVAAASEKGKAVMMKLALLGVLGVASAKNFKVDEQMVSSFAQGGARLEGRGGVQSVCRLDMQLCVRQLREERIVCVVSGSVRGLH